MEAHAGAGSWQNLWTSGERAAHVRGGLLAGLVTPWKGPMLQQSEGLPCVGYCSILTREYLLCVNGVGKESDYSA